MQPHMWINVTNTWDIKRFLFGHGGLLGKHPYFDKIHHRRVLDLGTVRNYHKFILEPSWVTP